MRLMVLYLILKKENNMILFEVHDEIHFDELELDDLIIVVHDFDDLRIYFHDFEEHHDEHSLDE